MTDVKAMIELLESLEVDFVVSQENDPNGHAITRFINYKEIRSEHYKLTSWEFAEDGEFLGENLDGILYARRFEEVIRELCSKSRHN